MAFAALGTARLPLFPAQAGSLTTLQDSIDATDRLLARPPRGLCRDASALWISPRAGHQLHGCLVTTVAGLPPASRIQLPRTHPRERTQGANPVPSRGRRADETIRLRVVTTTKPQEDPHGCLDRKARGRHSDPSVHDRDPRGRISMTCVRASRPRAGPKRRPSKICRRARASRRCRHSRAIGRPSTTGASARRELKSLAHFITEIDGLDIHFIHVRSEHEDALPLLVCHGWPGSIIEQLKIIDPLTNPTANGASAADAFHLVIPSMPGYGFSGKPTETGWDTVRMARAYTELMRRLGYDALCGDRRRLGCAYR